MEYCFIEKWQSERKLPENCKAVALTPNASCQLDKAGISYVTFGDFFSSGKIRGDADKYLESQVLWFKEFDRFICDIFSEAKKMQIGLPSLFFHNIKYLVDCLVLTSKIVRRFIEMTKPSKIWYVPEIYGEDKIRRWNWFNFGKSSFHHLTPLICKKDNIPFEELKFECESSFSAAGDEESAMDSVLGRNIALKNNLLAELRSIKKRLSRYSCLFNKPMLNGDKKAANVFVVRELSYTNDFYRDSKKAGFNVYYKENDNIYKLDWLSSGAKVNFKNGNNFDPANGINFTAALNDLVNGNIMRWINDQCGVDVSSILYPRLKFFLEEVFPEAIIRIKKYVEFYDNYNIDFVISYAVSTVDDFAAIAAARISRSTKSVSFNHGVDAYAEKLKFFADHGLFDIVFANVEEEASHIKGLSELFGFSGISAHEYSYFRKKFYGIREKRKNKMVKKHDKPLVLFLPIMRVERMNMPIGKLQSLQWDYFKWHSFLMDYFSSRNDFVFVWKSLVQRHGRGDTISQMMKDRAPENVIYSNTNIQEWFLSADWVICDIPSTAFFECVFAGLPVLSLYRPEDQHLRESACRSYASSLRPYSNVKEGVRAVEDFLNSDPRKYIVPHDPVEVLVPEILKTHLRKSRAGGDKH